MKPRERRILENLSAITELETWLRCARAELVGDPDNAALSEFVLLVAQLVLEKRRSPNSPPSALHLDAMRRSAH